jgi:hypothetical protein
LDLSSCCAFFLLFVCDSSAFFFLESDSCCIGPRICFQETLPFEGNLLSLVRFGMVFLVWYCLYLRVSIFGFVCLTIPSPHDRGGARGVSSVRYSTVLTGDCWVSIGDYSCMVECCSDAAHRVWAVCGMTLAHWTGISVAVGLESSESSEPLRVVCTAWGAASSIDGVGGMFYESLILLYGAVQQLGLATLAPF